MSDDYDEVIGDDKFTDLYRAATQVIRDYETEYPEVVDELVEQLTAEGWL